MKINPTSFFNFCANHAPLLRALTERSGEIAETEALLLVRANPGASEELPETAWRRLRELQILVPSEPGSALYILAEPVARLLTYLFDGANPATPEMVRGYVASLETLGKRLAAAIPSDDVTLVGLAFHEITTTLRRIHSDLEETQRAVQNEVAAFKVNREQMSVRDRYRRIVYWMERFIDPMIGIIQTDGEMAAVFEETERLLRRAREQSLFNDHPALERNLRYLRLVRQHALRVFQECRKELQPLYESLRRSSLIASGAALALEKLQREGLAHWGTQPVIGFCQLQIKQVPGDAAIITALRRVVEHPPETAPVVVLEEAAETPPALVRRLWLDALPAETKNALPVEDLLAWLTEKYPSKNTAEIMGGFSFLIFRDEFRSAFQESDEREYAMPDGFLKGHPLRLEMAEA